MKTLVKWLLVLSSAAMAFVAYEGAATGAVSAANAESGARPAGDQRSGARPTEGPAPFVRVPDDVIAHRDLAYVSHGHSRQKLDLFLPKKADAPLPLIIWIHGGGWQSGSKEQCLPLRSGFTDRGYAVASIGYRLSGDAVFPAQIEDCKAGIRWLRAHARQYNLDPDRFGVWGSSAGGHLVALVGTSGHVKQFETGEHPDVSSRVQAVCDYYGPTDLLEMDAHALPGSRLKHDPATSPESRLIGGAIQENPQKAARANPITYVTKDAPPFLIVHGDQDPTVPHHQSQLLYEALEHAGVAVRFHTVRGGGHGSGFGTPEIDKMVNEFFERHLKSKSPADAKPEAVTTESAASATGPPSPAPPRAGSGRRGIPWEVVLRSDANQDGKISREEFRGPPPLFDRLDRDRDGLLTREEHDAAFGPAPPGRASSPATAPEQRPSSERSAAPRPAKKRALPGANAGLLYYAKADYAFADNQNVIANPYIGGALFQVVWSEVEKQSGKCDWSQLDQWIEPWSKAGKKVAVRIMWSTSGNWPKPYYKTPTPAWVWREGAKFAFHAPSGTEMPLFWDPIYQKYAWRFLEQFAARYDGNPNLLFVDVTPGAETNPYRFARINVTHPEFKDEFERTRASDGRGYNEELWLETIKQWVDASDRVFTKTPLLVTLNVGGLRAQDRSVTIGDYCVERGFYVGQNGLAGRSFLDSSGGRTAAFHRWSDETKLFFEMVAGSGGRTGTLMEVMKAAERIGCSYLNVYPEDVLRGTRGQADFDPQYERSLEYGARVLGGKPAAPG